MQQRDTALSMLEDATFLEPDIYDAAIVGIAERYGLRPVVAYDLDKLINILQEDGMTQEEAIDFFDFNIVGAWMGATTPVFITLINNGEIA